MTSLLGNMGADWLLKRAFKFLLKKNLGSLLQNEVCKASHSPLARPELPQSPILALRKSAAIWHCQEVLPPLWTPECLT